jgi:hypothetical protein
MRYCTIDGCPNVHMARGWCPTHYTRWKRHGDPLASAPRQLCLNCDQPFSARKGGRHRSSVKPGWCTSCASPGRLDSYIDPRYCNCYGDDIPAPDPTGMCPDCYRLVEACSAPPIPAPVAAYGAQPAQVVPTPQEHT